MNIKEHFAIINIKVKTKKAVLNELAKKIFRDIKEIEEIMKKIDLNKKVDFTYVLDKLYVVNILKEENDIYLLFSEVENNSIVFNNFHTDKEGVDISLYQKEVLREFLEKFLALKRRYGGFKIKFLYLKIDFTLDLSLSLKRRILHKILKYTVAVTRSSDVVGQITENSFGIILTNATSDGANIVVNKILKFVSEINSESDKKLIEVHGALAHEIFILKNTDFNDFITKLEKNSKFITEGMKLKELV